MTSMDHISRTGFSIENGQKLLDRGDPLPRLLAQILLRAGADAKIERAASRPWASALFQGRRHVVMVRIGGSDTEEPAHRFTDGIEDAEWELKGHFVADMTVDDSIACPGGHLIELSALTIEDW